MLIRSRAPYLVALLALTTGDACRCGGAKAPTDNTDNTNNDTGGGTGNITGNGEGDVTKAVAGSDTIGCVGAATTLGAAVQNGITYAWSPDTGLSSTSDAQPSFQPTAPGTYTFNLTATSSAGTTQMSTVTVTVAAAPVAVIATTPAATCAGGSISFDGAGSTNASSYAWTLAGADTATSTVATPGAVQYSTAGSYTASLTVTDTNGCTASAQQTIDVCATFPVVNLSSAAQSVLESAGSTTLTATLDTAAVADVTVPFTLSGTAAAGTDYTAPSATSFVIPAGQSSASITINFIDNGLYETNKTLIVTLGTPQNATLGTTSVETVTIVENDTLPVLSASDLIISESAGNATLTLTLNGGSTLPISVSFATLAGTAQPNVNFAATGGTVSFAPGVTGQTLSIPVFGDTTVGPNTTFFVQLSNAQNATLADSLVQVTLVDDDGTPTLSVSDLIVSEGAGKANVIVTLSGANAFGASAGWLTSDGTAHDGVNYVGGNGIVSVPAGQVVQTIPIDLVNDNTPGPNVAFSLALTGPSGADISNGNATVTIIDDDGPATLSFADVTVSEAAGLADFIVIRSGSTSNAVSAQLDTADGTAVAPSNYLSHSALVALPAGGIFTRFGVIVVDDHIPDNTLTFSVNASAATGATLGTTTATGSILDADGEPLLSIDSPNARESAGSMTFDVNLSFASNQTITVNYTTGAASAEVGNDFLAISGTLTFTPGVLTQQISVPLVNDDISEYDEEFTVTLYGPVNALPGVLAGTGTITDHDPFPVISIGDVSVPENGGPAALTVALSTYSERTITVDYATSDGTALAGVNYITSTGSLVFAPGATNMPIAVGLIDDGVNSPTLTLTVGLSNVVDATLPSGPATVSITDADTPPILSLADVTVAENAGPAVFTFTLSHVSGFPVSVDYATNDGTAIGGTDFTPTGATFVLPPFATTGSISVDLVDDNINEATESFTVALSNVQFASLAASGATGTITDDDPVPTLSINDASVTEGGTLVFSVTLTGLTAQTVQVNYATSDNTTSPGDYTPAAGTLVFSPSGPTVQTISVDTVDDGVFEGTETLFVNLTSPVVANITNGLGTGTLFDTSSMPTLTMDPVTAQENAGNAVLTVKLSGPSQAPVTVLFSTADGIGANAAVAPTNYTSITNQLVTFTYPSTTQTVPVAVHDDGVFGPNLTFTASLSSPSGALGTPTATVTEVEVDGLPIVQFVQTTVSAHELSGVVAMQVVMSPPASSAVTVPFTVDAASTATPGSEYDITASPLTFSPGVTGQTIFVTLHDDGLYAVNDTVIVKLGAPSGASVGTNGQETLTIIDDNSEPSLSINDVSASESAGTLQFKVTLLGATKAAVSVDVQTADFTATVADGDYAPTGPYGLLFAPGVTGQTVRVKIFSDTFYEGDESFYVNLSNPVNALVTKSQGVGTLQDNQSEPTVSMGDISVAESATGATFRLTLSNPSEAAVSVHFNTANGSAISGTNYTAVSQTVSFPSMATGATVTVPILDDGINSPSLTFQAILSGASGVTGTLPSATATITDADPTPTISFSTASASVGENGGSTSVRVNLSHASGFVLSVPFAIDGTSTATNGSDYTLGATSPLVLPTGSTGAVITINILQDLLPEPPETVKLKLQSGSNYSLLAPTGYTLTILDDDSVPVLSSAATIDANGDGYLDGYQLTFSTPMDDTTFPGYVSNSRGTAQAVWSVSGYTGLVLANGTAAPSGFTDTANDSVLYVVFNQTGTPDTAATPDITTTASPGLKDTFGNALAQITANSSTRVDKAAPVIVQSFADLASNQLQLKFSEPVTPTPGSPCTGTVNASADLAYNDVSLSGVNGVTNTGAASLTGCSGSISVAVTPVDFTASDLYVDEVGAVANKLFDVPGNAMSTAQSIIVGIVHPYVLSVVSLDSTDIRITYSEAVDSTQATTVSNYTYSLVAASGGCAATGLTGPVTVSSTTYDFTTSPQSSACTYELNVTGNVTDVVFGSNMVPPTFGTFIGNQQLMVVTATAVSPTGFIITFSKDVQKTAGAGSADNTSYYTIPAALGTVVSAQRYDEITGVSTDASKVFITHSLSQGREFYSVVVNTALRNAANTENLASPPQNTATFAGFGGPVVTPDDGPLFADPFGDGTSFSFTFSYQGKVYVGPDQTNSAVFRMDPDGQNSVRASFLTQSATTPHSFTTFGANTVRPAVSTKTVGTSCQYSFDTPTNLLPYSAGNAVTVTGCVNATNNKAATTLAAVSAASGWVQIAGACGATVTAGTACTTVANCPNTTNYACVNNICTETCQVSMYNAAGPAHFSGVDAFTSVDMQAPPVTAATVAIPATGTTRYTVPSTVNLQLYDVGDAVTIAGCTNAANNMQTVISKISALTFKVDVVGNGVAATGETCKITFLNHFLVYGGHDSSGGGFLELPFTQQTGLVLSNSYCNIGTGVNKVTLGNTTSLQTVFGYGGTLFIGFGSDSNSGLPLFATMNLNTAAPNDNTNCGALNNTVINGNKDVSAVPYIGGKATPGNSASIIGIDSMAFFNDGGGDKLYLANNGGIETTSQLPPSGTATWSNVRTDGDGTFAGTTRSIPSVGQLRPGQKGIPFMVQWGTTLMVARNRNDTNTAELYKFPRGGSFSKVADTAIAGLNANDSAISLLTVNGSRLYVGFDNATNGAELWRTKSGVTASSLSGNGDWEKVGQTGMGPLGDTTTNLAKNKYFISNTSVFFNGKNYLYLTIGCDSDYSDNGACDRDPTVGSVDFAIRLFRQVD